MWPVTTCELRLLSESHRYLFFHSRANSVNLYVITSCTVMLKATSSWIHAVADHPPDQLHPSVASLWTEEAYKESHLSTQRTMQPQSALRAFILALVSSIVVPGRRPCKRLVLGFQSLALAWNRDILQLFIESMAKMFETLVNLHERISRFVLDCLTLYDVLVTLLRRDCVGVHFALTDILTRFGR